MLFLFRKVLEEMPFFQKVNINRVKIFSVDKEIKKE